MPRLPERVISRLQPASTQSSGIATSDMTALSTTEARAVATQAIDAVESRAGLEVLAVDMPDGTYILDNQNRDVKLKYLSGEAHYQPIFALARRKQWLYGRPTT